jgi:NADPH-dependent ferric siderophore reductase
MDTYTPIQDIDQKIDIIDHVNQDHTEELLAIAKSHLSQTKSPHETNIRSASVLDIFQEGIDISVHLKTTPQNTKIFVPFEIEGELEDKILYQAYASIIQQGRDFSGVGKRFFKIIDKQKITTNIVRLTIESTTELPAYYPGYAYAFLLKTLKKRPLPATPESNKKHWSKKLFDRVFISLMKYLSSKNRQKLLQSANKDVRLYTLRKSWKKNKNDRFHNQGYIDIFTHGETLGSQWANELNTDDIIMSRSEAKDKHPHLSNGQALLIADETAYPAMAGILEHWQNPLPPHIIIISESEDEQCYFEDKDQLAAGQIHRIICPPENQATEILAIVKQITDIDVVWAAFESESAKAVRHYLRNHRKIAGKNNHTKAYWNLKSKRGTVEDL